MSKFNEYFESIMNEVSDEYNVYTKRNGKWGILNKSVMTKKDAETLMKDTEKAGIGSISDISLVHVKAKAPK